MAETRETKRRAQRIDLGYIDRPHWLRRGRVWAGVVAFGVAFAWIACLVVCGKRGPVSPGPVATAHHMYADDCASCHVATASSAWSLEVTNDACQKCHRVPVHQPIEGEPAPCASCHVEHRAKPALADVATQRCTSCHGDLLDPSGPAAAYGASPALARDGYAKIARFGRTTPPAPDDHKEFRVWVAESGPDARQRLDPRTPPADRSRVKFSHKRHLSRTLMGPDGKWLACGDCHRGTFEKERLPYAKRGSLVRTSASPQVPQPAPSPQPLGTAERPEFAPAEEPDYFAPVRYEAHCAGCHPHTFDDRIDAAPHDAPYVVRRFLEGAYVRYARGHRDVIAGTPRHRPFDGRGPAFASSPEQWAADEVQRAEKLLYRRPCPDGENEKCQRCIECHFVRDQCEADGPDIVAPAIPSRWLPQSRFDHAAHRDVRCKQCHTDVMKSAAATDVLMPTITRCRKCHNAGGASDRCAECHTYHGAMEPKGLNSPHPNKQLTASSGGGGT